MSDFCRQCSIDMFGEDFKELVGITKEEDWNKGLAGWTICEGCGQTQVDPKGTCVRNDCIKKQTEDNT